MIASAFFHKYKRTWECIPSDEPELAEEYRRRHRENFRGVSEYFDSVLHYPSCEAARARLTIDKDRKESCIRLACWMSGNSDVTGKEYEDSQSLMRLCNALDNLQQAVSPQPAWARLELSFFERTQVFLPDNTEMAVYCSQPTMAFSAAKVLTVLTGCCYLPVHHVGQVRSVLESGIGTIWLKPNRGCPLQQEFLRFIKQHQNHRIDEIDVPISLAALLAHQSAQ